MTNPRLRVILLAFIVLLPLALQAQQTPAQLKGEYIYLEARRQILAGKVDAAFELLEYSHQLNPDHAATLYALAPLLVALQRDSLATVSMQRAVTLVPDNYWYQDLLAKLQFAAHRPAQAIQTLEQMNRRWSDKSEPLYLLADAYASQNMADSLLHTLERLEVKEGKNEQFSLEKIQVFVQRNDVRALIDELEALLQANPHSPLPGQLLPRLLKEKTDAFILLGDLYHQVGNDDRAFQYYDSCLVYKPDEPLVLNNYAYYLSLQQRNLDTAEQMSRRSLELEPDNPTYLDTLAWILFQQGRYAEAKTLIDQVVRLMPPEQLDLSDDVKDHLRRIHQKVSGN